MPEPDFESLFDEFDAIFRNILFSSSSIPGHGTQFSSFSSIPGHGSSSSSSTDPQELGARPGSLRSKYLRPVALDKSNELGQYNDTATDVVQRRFSSSSATQVSIDVRPDGSSVKNKVRYLPDGSREEETTQCTADRICQTLLRLFSPDGKLLKQQWQDT